MNEGIKDRSLDNSEQISRCAHMTSTSLDKLEKSKNEANTVRQTTEALNCSQTWLSLKNVLIFNLMDPSGQLWAD